MTTVPATLPDAIKQLLLPPGYNPPALERAAVLLLGDIQVGKTSLVTDIPNSVTLDLEGKASGIARRRSECIRINSYVTLLEVLSWLTSDPAAKAKYTTVAIDTGGKLGELVRESLKLSKGSDVEDLRGGKGGWSLYAGMCLTPFRKLLAAGYGTWWVGHYKWVAVDGKAPVRALDMTDLIRGGLQKDCHLFVGVEKKTVKVPTRWTEVSGQKIAVDWDDVLSYVLTTRPNLGRKPVEGEFTCSTQVPMPAEIVLPERHPYDAVKAAYDRSVSEKKAELSAEN